MGKASRGSKNKEKAVPAREIPEAVQVASKPLLRRPVAHLILIALLGLFAYSNSFDVPFQFDDAPNIVENPIIKDLSCFVSPAKAKGIPQHDFLRSRYVGQLSFALNYKINGLNATGYHAINLAIHILNAFLIYWIVALTFRTPFMKSARLGEKSGGIALFASLLFVAHPVQTQAVTYIVQRLASLVAMFYILALALYIKARLSGEPRRHWAYYAFSLLCAVAAMKTKENAFTLPMAVALYEFMFLKGALKKRTLYLAPLLLTMVIIPLSLLGAEGPLGDIIGDVSRAARLETEAPRLDYLFTQFNVVVTYISLLFLPLNQNLDYDYPVSHSFFETQVFLSFLFLVSILGLGVYLLRRSRTSKPVLRLASFGIFWFFITLSVESSIIPIADVIFEHRVYLPSVGFFIAAATACILLLRASEKTEFRKAAIAALCIVPVVLASAAHARNKAWQSKVSLWEDVVKKSPYKARGHYNLAVEYKAMGLVDNSIAHLQRAVELNPGFAEAHNNLANAYKSKGLYDKAITHFLETIRLDPKFAVAYYNLGNTYGAMGDFDSAIKYLSNAVRLSPEAADAHHNLGNAYLSQGQYSKALEHYKTSLRLRPEDSDTHFNTGVAYYRSGDIEMARREFEETLRLNPGHAQARRLLRDIGKERQ